LNGLAADRLDRRKLLLGTQAAMGVLALGLGILTVAGIVRLWHVYAFALLLGCVTAFDSPARHTFVSELVGEADLSNAVALNSASFNVARMIGPAIAGVLIATAGSGWVLLISAASFAAVLCSLGLLRVGELHRKDRALRAQGGLAEGFRYVWSTLVALQQVYPQLRRYPGARRHLRLVPTQENWPTTGDTADLPSTAEGSARDFDKR
jgi:MFS family permease